MMKKRILTFESDTSRDSLYLFGSPDALLEFADNIKRLVENTKDGHFEHDHFMTPDWGGDFLTSEKQSEDGKVVHHLKVYCIKGEAMQW